MRVRGLDRAIPLRVVAAFTVAGTLTFFCTFAAILLLVAAFLSPAKAGEQECNVSAGPAVAAQVEMAKKALKSVVILENKDVADFLLALKEVTDGKVDLPGGPKLIFIEMEKDGKKGWKMIGFGPQKDGQDCVLGAVGLPGEFVTKILERVAQDKQSY